MSMSGFLHKHIVKRNTHDAILVLPHTLGLAPSCWPNAVQARIVVQTFGTPSH